MLIACKCFPKAFIFDPITIALISDKQDKVFCALTVWLSMRATAERQLRDYWETALSFLELLVGAQNMNWCDEGMENCLSQSLVCTRSISSLDSRWRFLVPATPPAAAASEAMASCCWWCSCCPAPSSCCPGSPAATAGIPGSWWGEGLCWWGSSWGGTPWDRCGKVWPMTALCWRGWWRGQTRQARPALAWSRLQATARNKKKKRKRTLIFFVKQCPKSSSY